MSDDCTREEIQKRADREWRRWRAAHDGFPTERDAFMGGYARGEYRGSENNALRAEVAALRERCERLDRERNAFRSLVEQMATETMVETAHGAAIPSFFHRRWMREADQLLWPAGAVQTDGGGV